MSHIGIMIGILPFFSGSQLPLSIATSVTGWVTGVGTEQQGSKAGRWGGDTWQQQVLSQPLMGVNCKDWSVRIFVNLHRIYRFVGKIKFYIPWNGHEV